MTALTAGRNTKERDPRSTWQGPVAAAVKCFAGGFAVRDSSGNLKPAVTATGLVVAGRFEETVDNTAGAAGDVDRVAELGERHRALQEDLSYAMAEWEDRAAMLVDGA